MKDNSTGLFTVVVCFWLLKSILVLITKASICVE